MSKYSVGVDFGTLSARALLVNNLDGTEIYVSEYEYPHGVMRDSLPDGTKLGSDWALQHPHDYIEALSKTVSDVIVHSGIDKNDITGIGIDFTSCTILPVQNDGTPLCMISGFEGQPHAYAKLWQHHAAQRDADALNSKAAESGQSWLSLYGGRISSEWLVPKAMQMSREAPDVYDASDRIIEAGDWIVWQLCGEERRSACNAGYKALWQGKYPSNEFFRLLNPRLENIVAEKLSDDIRPLGGRAGVITKKAAQITGLREGTAVAVGIIDAHASVPACKISGPGKMLMIIGTSTCHMLLSNQKRNVPGNCGVVENGILPGLYAYEAGQCCVGDSFSWFVHNYISSEYEKAAKAAGVNIHKFLREKAEKLKPGENGLLALDWWSGVRSTLMDADLSGLILGLTLQTKPEEIYRALIEATAYGTRYIIENFESAGIRIDELYAAGGIASKDSMTMQIYADVSGREIKISGSSQSAALGSAIFGAVAAGKEKGGYDDIYDAINSMGKLDDKVYRPVPENTEAYDKLYREYKTLVQYFGCGGNDVMKLLKKLKK